MPALRTVQSDPRPCRRMTRCECMGKTFAEAADFARASGIQDFHLICELVGIGKLCTACHCDLKHALDAAEDRAAEPLSPARG